MARKSKTPKSATERPLPPLAGMRFWSRFGNPPPMLAFAFAEPADDADDALDLLNRLPKVKSDASATYSVRISLDGSKPPAWRRILLRSVSLELLHHVIQLAMGWKDCHLHGFEVSHVHVPLVEDGAAIDERGISIAQLHAAGIKKFRYVYDFGDHWQHTVLIESRSTGPTEIKLPHCVTGKGACPLEDIGGVQNWSKLLEVLKNSDVTRDDDIESLLDRVGENYVPPPFDVDQTNQRLKRMFRKRRQIDEQR